MQAQLKAKLEDEEIETEALIELIKSAKSAMSKLQMAKEILKMGKIETGACKEIMEFLTEQVAENQVAKRHCEIMSKALLFYDYLSTIDSEIEIFPRSYENSEEIQEDFNCTSYDSANFHDLYKNENLLENSRINMDMASFMACFQLLHESEDSNDNLPIR